MFREFDYTAPGNLKKILAALAEGGPNAAILAGGTDLVVEMRAGVKRPGLLVDIKRARELQGIGWERGRGLVIGATATMRDLIDNPDAAKKFPFLVEAALQVASPQLRNRATVVGNLCTASPCTDMGRALVCIGAQVVIARGPAIVPASRLAVGTLKRGRAAAESAGRSGPGRRRTKSASGAVSGGAVSGGSDTGFRVVPAADFFTGVKQTCLAPGEIVTAVVAPARAANARGGHEKLKRVKGHDIAVASVSLAIFDDPAGEKTMRIAVGSCARTPVVIEFPVQTPLEEVLAAVNGAVAPIDDIRATAEYRRFMVKTYTERLMALHLGPRRRGRPARQ